MSVYSEPGHGSTFRIYLPAASGEDEILVEDGASRETDPLPLRGPAAQPEKPAGGERPTILLVDDEEQLRNLSRESLEMQGYRVLEARDGGQALLICEKHQGVIDLMITDVIMPRMSGPQLYERLKHVRPEMRVLFISGYTAGMIREKGLLDPGSDFLQKPFSPDALARRVQETLRQRRAA
jgi:CheY-like chemotaxis protein